MSSLERTGTAAGLHEGEGGTKRLGGGEFREQGGGEVVLDGDLGRDGRGGCGGLVGQVGPG